MTNAVRPTLLDRHGSRGWSTGYHRRHTLMRFWQQAIWSKELVHAHSTGLVEDKSQYIQAVTSGNQRYDSIDYEAPAIQTYGSTAVVATKVVMTGATKDQPFNNRLRLLHVWVKQGAKWSLVAHQTTRLP